MGILQFGFKNVYEHDKAVGFQVKVKNTFWYMGFYASLLESFVVTVDGETFPRDKVKCTIGTKTFSQNEFNGSREFLEFTEPVTLTVSKPGGLKPGMHNVEVNNVIRMYYSPNPEDIGLASSYSAKIAIV